MRVSAGNESRETVSQIIHIVRIRCENQAITARDKDLRTGG